MKCEYCEILDRKDEIIFQDEEVVVAVKDSVIASGQITVFPKEHLTILEMVPDNILEKCSIIANKVSMTVFEMLGSQGTNIVIKNGLGAGQSVPHFGIDVIPRKENDGLNLQWEPKQLEEHDIQVTLKTLKDQIANVGKDIKELKEDAEEIAKEKAEKNKNNYMIKSLKRLP